MKKIKFLILTLVISLILTSCKDHYNDTIHWVDQLDEGLTTEEVRDLQPDYLEIDWEDPKVNDTETMYIITNIKGNHDFLNMSHYLVFVDGKFKGRSSHK